MKSIKPGRGPSKMGAVGGVFAACFGIVWCIVAASIGATFMIPFGLIFIGLAVYIAIYNGHNATSEDRYSILDIVDDDEESDPMNDMYGRKNAASQNEGSIERRENSDEMQYCPYCGTKVGGDFEFCPKCGKKLPN